VEGPAPVIDTSGAADPDDTHPAVAEARRHLGLPYLWSGVSPLGFDCSGLVLHTWRLLGVVVARDAYAQAELATPVELDAVESGDLYFFARPGQRIHHVGIVVRPGRMVHASETGRVLVEEDLPADRLATLVAAGRLPTP
jgi:cell wall-associated NlpC family hydrolase